MQKPAFLYTPAIPALPIASNYPLNKQCAPLAVYGKGAPLRRKLRGKYKLTRKAKRYENEQSETAHGGFSQLVLVQLSMTSSGEGRWLSLQIQHLQRIFYRASQQPLTGSHR